MLRNFNKFVGSKLEVLSYSTYNNEDKYSTLCPTP